MSVLVPEVGTFWVFGFQGGNRECVDNVSRSVTRCQRVSCLCFGLFDTVSKFLTRCQVSNEEIEGVFDTLSKFLTRCLKFGRWFWVSNEEIGVW